MALALLVASTIHAQGVGTTMPVYHEDFASESTFPTEPELDVFGQGGMVRYPFVGAGSSVVLDGASARLSLAAGTAFQPLFAGAGLASWSVPGEPLVVSVTFGGYASNLGDLGVQSFLILAGLQGGSVQYGLALSNGVASLGGSVAGNPLMSVELPVAERDAIASGASFRISLVYVESEGRIAGEVQVDGFPTKQGPTTLAALGPPAGSLWSVAYLFPLLDGHTFDADLRSFEIATPEPGVATALAAGSVVLSQLHARRRTRVVRGPINGVHGRTVPGGAWLDRDSPDSPASLPPRMVHRA